AYEAQDLRRARAPARGAAAHPPGDRGLMADEDTPQHAVPGEDAAEIAGSAEDAALEAAEEAAETGAEAPEPATVEPAGEGHAVPTADAQEIAGSAEDAALEAAQEAQDAEAETVAESEEDLDEDAEAEQAR